MTHIGDKTVIINDLRLSSQDVIHAVGKTNQYLNQISQYFIDLDIEIFHILGQRNISGFIGEVFSKFLEKEVVDLKSNPHQDGRPDLINLSTIESKDFFSTSFVNENHNNPIKKNFTPYPFGGVEVKCSIGDFRPMKREVKSKILQKKYGVDNVDIKIPRIEFFSGINYWAHHQNCSNLLGLYYDYYEKSKFNPQIISVFYATLERDDWYDLSIGKEGSKKTSNTSLRPSGKDKIKRGMMSIIDDELYIDTLKSRGYCL
jgi:hypothetical protein